VIDEGAVYVTEGSDRRSTGTHYTPRTLTEPIVQHTLDPLVYAGPSEGKAPEEWVLKPPKEILALRVCDLAMGSGAFLVQTCRYLAQKLVEGWETAERAAGDQLVLAPDGDLSKGKPGDTLVPREVEERLVLARRFVADRCLYGVDVNPMAVEMAKLSLWLVTLQKDRPFSFVDHALRMGDSLLGVTSQDQLLYFHLDPKRGKKLHDNLLGLDEKMKAALARSRELREKLESFPVRDISDSKQKEWLFGQANEATEDLRTIGDLLIGVALATAGKKDEAFDDQLRDVSPLIASVLTASADARTSKRIALRAKAGELVDQGREESHAKRQPFHWAIEFPEAMQRGGFDAFVGNPPFRGGKLITGILGTDYREHLVRRLGEGRKGHADLCAYFFLRAAALLNEHGAFGLLATNTIAQGDTREVALDALTARGLTIMRAVPSRKWPGTANLEVSHVWMCRGAWAGECVLDDQPVPAISAQLTRPGRAQGTPRQLVASTDKAFIGSYVLGLGFTLTPDQAMTLISADKKNRDVLFPYVNGQDLNSSPDQSGSRWVINFRDWPLDRRTAPPGYRGSVASDYADCLEIVSRLVKPERQRTKPDGSYALRNPLPQRWWQYADKRPSLYATISDLGRVLACSRVQQFWIISSTVPGAVFSDATVVIALNTYSSLALLQSSFHEQWALGDPLVCLLHATRSAFHTA
jgi:hypothetical protein